MGYEQGLAALDAFVDLSGNDPCIGYSYAQASLGALKQGYAIKKLVPNGVTIVFGESQAMKSFVVTDMAWHVASGLDWCGNRVKKHGVLVILGEGQDGFKKRLVALKKVRGDNAAIWVHPEPVNLLSGVDAMTDILAHAEASLGLRIGMVAFDTFSLMLGDGDENTAKDTGLAFNNARHVFADRALVFVHHSGHSDKTRERGSYQIQGNADSRISVSRNDRIISVTHIKTKDDRLCDPIALTYEVVDLGKDSDGDPITSLILSQTNAPSIFDAMDVAQCREVWQRFARAPLAERSASPNSQKSAKRLIESLLPDQAQDKAKQIMDAWIKSGVLKKHDFQDKHRNYKQSYVVDFETSGGVVDDLPT